MANTYTPSSLQRIPTFGDGKNAFIKVGTLVIDTVGGAEAGDIPASLFGFDKILGCYSIVKSDNSTMYTGMPAADGESLLIQGISATAETTFDDPDYTTTVTTAVGTMDLPAGTYVINLIGKI